MDYPDSQDSEIDDEDYFDMVHPFFKKWAAERAYKTRKYNPRTLPL